MVFIFIIAAFVSVAPLMLLLSAKTIAEYAAWTAPLSSLFKVRTFSFAVAAGGIAGIISVLLTEIVNSIFFADFSFVTRPSEGLNWTIQVAFINAGLVEEALKCLVAVTLVLLIARNPHHAENSPEQGGLFLKSTPFLCGAVGLGFAGYENYHYIRGYSDAGVASMVLVRGLVSAPIHTAINFNFGLSLLAARGRDFPAVFLSALLVAVLQHGVFDFFALPPVPFSSFLSQVFALGLIAYVVGRAYKVLPEMRFSSWVQRATAEEEEALESAEESSWQLSPTALAFLERGLLRDEHRQVRPPVSSPPFAEEEFPFPSPEVREAFLRYEYQGHTPENDREYREFFEARAREAFAPAPAYVWDSSVFAEDLERGGELFRELDSMGIDLTRLVPLRVLEFSPTGGLPGAYRYLSCGLGPILGRELLVSFPFPFSLARVFFTAVAAGVLAGPAENFELLSVRPQLLGDPRGWFRGVMPVPLLDPVRERLEKAFDGRCPLPAEVLYLSRSDLRFIRRYGLQSYFSVLKDAGASWYNDFRRPALEVEETDASAES